jgi:hypothetical protein
MRSVFLLFVLFTNTATAQKRERVETPFNSFIHFPSVLWAINANDTIRFEKPNLSELLVQRLLKGEIKIAYIFDKDNDTEAEKNLEFKTKAEYTWFLDSNIIEVQMNDPYGNVYAPKKIKTAPDPILPLIELYQKIYIENDKLLSYISYVSPVKKLITPQGLDLGNLEIFSTAFNTEYKTDSSLMDTVILLGTSSRIFYMDSTNKYENCKETLGRNLIETLWPSIEKDKIEIYSYPENKKISYEMMNERYILNKEYFITPLCDSLGFQTGTLYTINEAKPNVINKITITQQWYYNETKNIVFCKIPSAILSIPKLNDADNTVHEIKIVF